IMDPEPLRFLRPIDSEDQSTIDTEGEDTSSILSDDVPYRMNNTDLNEERNINRTLRYFFGLFLKKETNGLPKIFRILITILYYCCLFLMHFAPEKTRVGGV
ncbi:Protein CBG08431, partial [Caenorhabditis briggsae]